MCNKYKNRIKVPLLHPEQWRNDKGYKVHDDHANKVATFAVG